jgi:hypothetical protein
MLARHGLLALALAATVACTAPGDGSSAPSAPGRGPSATRPSPGGRSTADARVRSFAGRVPPELAPDARWLGAPPSSLAALRGRVVYVQFAFPT